MNTATGIISKIVSAIVMPVLAVIFALAVLYFVWGVAGLILNKDDADKRNDSKNHILYATLGMAIMVSAYGIIRFVAATIGVASPF